MGKIEYRHVIGFPDYMVGSDGSVISKRKNGSWKKMTPVLNRSGYYHIELANDEGNKQFLVHRLVASAFLDNPDLLPCVNHKDETKTNNSVENLEWCTYKYNSNYGTCQDRKAKAINYYTELQFEHRQHLKKLNSKPVLQISKEGTVINKFESTMDAQRSTGFDNAKISSVCRGVRKSAYGFSWAYERS